MKCFTPNQLTGLISGVLIGGIIMTLVTIAFMFYWKKIFHKSPSGVKNIENGGSRREASQNAKSYTNILFKDDAGKKVFVDIPLNENDEPMKYFAKDSQDLTSKGVNMRTENLKKQNNAVIKLKRLSKPSISFSSSKKLWGSEDKPKLSSKSFKVPLKSQDFTGLGFNIYGDVKNGIFIKEILNRGPARESGKIKPGDRIVNLTIAFSNIVFEDALTILSYASPYEITLEILREKSDTSIDSEFESINYEPQNLEQDIKKSITPEAQLILTVPKDVTKYGRSNYKEKMSTPIIVQNSRPTETVEAIQTESVQAQAQSAENHSHSITASQPKLSFSSKNLKNWFYSSNNTTDPTITNASGHITSNNEESVINDVIERSNDSISERHPMEQKIPSNTSLDDDIENVIMTYEKSHKAPVRSSSFSKHLALFKQKPKREDLNAKGKTQAIKSNLSKSTNEGQNQATRNDSDSDTGSQLKRLSRSLENVYHKYLDIFDNKIGHQDENKIKRSQSLMHHKAMELPSIFKKGRKSNEDVVARRGTIIEGNCVDLKGGEIIAKQFSKCQPRKSTFNLESISPHSIFAVDNEPETYALQGPPVSNSNINTSLPSPSKPKYRVQFEDTHKSQQKDDEFNYDANKQQSSDTVKSFKKIMERFGEPSSEEEERESIKDEDFNLKDEPNTLMTSNQTADKTMSDDKTSMNPKSNSIVNNEFKIEKGRVGDKSNRTLTPISEETIFSKVDSPLFKPPDLRGTTAMTFPIVPNIAEQHKIEKTLEEEKVYITNQFENFNQDNSESNTTNFKPELSNVEGYTNDAEPAKTEKRKRNQPLKLHTNPLKNKIVGTAHRIIGTNVEALQEQESKKSYSQYNVNNNNNNKTNIVQDQDHVFVKNDLNYSSRLNREKILGNKSHVSNDVKKANYFCDYTGKIFPSGADDNKPAFLIFSPSCTAFYEDDSFKSNDSPIYDNHSLDSLPTVELEDRINKNNENCYSFQGMRSVLNQQEQEIFKTSAKKSKGSQRRNILKPLNTFFGSSQGYNDESINIKGSRGNSFKSKFKRYSNQIFDNQVTGQELGSNYQMIETKHDCRIADLKPIQYPMDKKQTPWISVNTSYENHSQYIPRHHDVTSRATNHKKRHNYSQRQNIYNAVGVREGKDYSLITTNNFNQQPSHFDNNQRLSRVYSSCKYNYQGNRNRAHSFKGVFRSSTKSKNYNKIHRGLSKPIYGLPQSPRNYSKQTVIPFTKRDILYSN